ncbi:MAG: hypothetical protein R3185_07865, partial [Candidatus Thermoplasmatota archaeon]|nr:hypothetical protein [Candidatus Thermoplasmatota archaeon]
GEQHTITVLDVVEGVANLEARVDGALATTYTYDASTGWFGEIQFYDANETIVFEAGPTDAGTSFTGEVARWTFHADVGGGGTLQPVALPINVEFDVPEEATDIWVSLEAHCPSGAFLFGFGPEDEGPGGENGWGVIEPCPYMTSFETVAVEDPVPGRWDGGVIAGSPAAQGEFLFVIVVRTLERVPVTA